MKRVFNLQTGLALVVGIVVGMAILQSENVRLRKDLQERGTVLGQPRIGPILGVPPTLVGEQQEVGLDERYVVFAPVAGSEEYGVIFATVRERDGRFFLCVPKWEDGKPVPIPVRKESK